MIIGMASRPVDWIGLGGGLLSSDLQGAFRNALNLVLAEFWNFFWPLAHRLIGNAEGFGYLRNAAEVADHLGLGHRRLQFTRTNSSMLAITKQACLASYLVDFST